MSVRIAAAAATLLLAATVSAQAAPIHVRDNPNQGGGPHGIFANGYSRQFNVYWDNTNDSVANGHNDTALAGVYDLQYRTSTSDPWTNILSACIEYTQYLDVGTGTQGIRNVNGTTYDTTSWAALGISTTAATYIEKLWYNASSLATASNNASAAIQTLIWEAITDVNFDIVGTGNNTTNRFTTRLASNDAMIQLATQWHNNIINGTWSQRQAITPLAHVDKQNLIVVLTSLPLDDPQPVPAPAALGLLGLGAAALIRRQRTLTA